MIIVANSMRDIDFSKLTELYKDVLDHDCRNTYQHLDRYEGRICAENDLRAYLKEVFFGYSKGRYYINIEHGQYVSALRIEPYKDGLLLNALMTAEDYRRKGFASCLLKYALSVEDRPIYSHIHRNNRPSVALHEKFGFIKLLDHSVFLDGSVHTDHITYIKPV